MSERRKTDIFISYSHRDDRFLATIMAALAPLAEAEKLSVFTDRGGIKPGDSFENTIRAALNEMRLFVFLVSPRAADSDFIRRHELPAAEKRHLQGQIRALPVMISETPKGDVWGWLWALQFAGLSEGISGEALAASALDKVAEAQLGERARTIAMEIITAAKSAPSHPRPGISGERAALRCNRSELVEIFEAKSKPFQARPPVEVWLIPGEDEDMPHGIARRLYLDYVWETRQETESDRAAGQEMKRLDWPGPHGSETQVLAAIERRLAKTNRSRVAPDAPRVVELLRQHAEIESCLGFRLEIDLREHREADVDQVRQLVAAARGLGVTSAPGMGRRSNSISLPSSS